jgi:pterin-4a-carbinolamine dehydratase
VGNSENINDLKPILDSGWNFNSSEISRRFHFQSFHHSWSFVNLVVEFSIEIGKFPRIEIDDLEVEISIKIENSKLLEDAFKLIHEINKIKI